MIRIINSRNTYFLNTAVSLFLFRGSGLALGWDVRRFQYYYYMFSYPTPTQTEAQHIAQPYFPRFFSLKCQRDAKWTDTSHAPRGTSRRICTLQKEEAYHITSFPFGTRLAWQSGGFLSWKGRGKVVKTEQKIICHRASSPAFNTYLSIPARTSL